MSRPFRSATVSTFEEWRETSRDLLNSGVSPDEVFWVDGRVQQGTLPGLRQAAGGHDQGLHPEACLKERAKNARVPKAFLDLASNAACHRDPDRWSLLYRVLWRLTHGESRLLDVFVDDDVRRLLALDKQVRFDAHKMKAFVRFRRVVIDGEEAYVAWHQPAHYTLGLTAPFFMRRFPNMKWAILTPDESVYWDRSQLRTGPGVPRSAAPSGDEVESLWLTYYRSIFNPARVKLRAMRREMPQRYWATMPETQLIRELVEAAEPRVAQMREVENAWPSAAAFLPSERTLPLLARAAAGCRGCPLHECATQTVFGEGPASARLVLVGEQPGDSEDQAGRPFVGPAGQLLDEALAAAGLNRSELYLTNAVKHFKFVMRGARRIHSKPHIREVQACRPWLEAELAEIRPDLIVCLGSTAAQAVLGHQVRVLRDRGKLLPHPAAKHALITLHPSAVLRIPDVHASEQAKADLISDLALAAATLH